MMTSFAPVIITMATRGRYPEINITMGHKYLHARFKVTFIFHLTIPGFQNEIVLKRKETKQSEE